MTFGGVDPDWPIRVAAFAALRRAVASGGPVMPWGAIAKGFTHAGRSFLFANQTKGIFRPAGMVGAALSIKTTIPRSGPPKYEDIASDGGFAYAFQRQGEDYHDNKILILAAELRTPIIYFYGMGSGRYRPIWPAYVAEVDKGQQTFTILAEDEAPLEPGQHVADPTMTAVARRYATAMVKRRLHQELFREIVLSAYETRCAICGLPRAELIDAAHIEPDRDVLGEPEITNGLALCKLHHGAYDANLLGIRPDRLIEISPLLKDVRDGPTFEHAIRGVHGQAIVVPRRREHHPSVAHLEARYEIFRNAG
ncbi:MAG TPA: HNH endonuclease [Polyangiaceae bacterium]|nr:HNH endonuclease [Polyangiaceae bacterium]